MNFVVNLLGDLRADGNFSLDQRPSEAQGEPALRVSASAQREASANRILLTNPKSSSKRLRRGGFGWEKAINLSSAIESLKSQPKNEYREKWFRCPHGPIGLGLQVAASMTAELVIEAIKKAILRERLPVGLIVHSDRGGQYVDAEFRGLLDQRGFEQSMSRADETYDNAHAESLFSRYKAELLEGGAFTDVEEARMETFIYIESYYNQVRRRSALGYQSPEDFERVHYQRTGARENFGQRPGKDTIAKQHSCPLK